jgi:Rrf2 family protein
MKLHKTTEYALKVLIYIARNHEKNHSAQKLHEALDIPYKYLGRIMTDLAKTGFLKVTRGKFGGYILAKAPADVRLAHILNAFEGEDLFERCMLGYKDCSPANPCELHKHYLPIRNTMKLKFNKLSLKDVIS